jgi:hypothetical protein
VVSTQSTTRYPGELFFFFFFFLFPGFEPLQNLFFKPKVWIFKEQQWRLPGSYAVVGQLQVVPDLLHPRFPAEIRHFVGIKVVRSNFEQGLVK